MTDLTAGRNQTPDLLITAEAISKRVGELGEAISRDYAGRDLVVVGLLLGALPFVSDLVRHITVPVEVDVMVVKSYGMCRTSSGDVQIRLDIERSVKDRHVLIVEDIVDTGLTLREIRSLLMQRGAATVATCALLSKPSRRRYAVPVEYCGFVVEDQFVVGYGLDDRGLYRNLPYIGVVNT